MENLFDLIFSNFGVLLLVLGGIYSFLKRNTSQKEEQQRKPIPKKITPPILEEVKRIEIERPKMRDRKMPRTEKPVITLQNVPSEPVRRMAQKHKEIKKQTQRKQHEPHEPLISSEPDHIIQGIIWSEIIGPPKAKAPHLSRKTNRI